MRLLSSLALISCLGITFADWEWLGSYRLPEEDYCHDCGGCLTYLIFFPSPGGRTNVYKILGEAWENVNNSNERNGPLPLITDGSEEDENGVIWSYRVGIGWAMERENDDVHFQIFFPLWGVENLCNTTLTRIDCSREPFCSCVDQTRCPGWGWSSLERECRFNHETTQEEQCPPNLEDEGSSSHHSIPTPPETSPPTEPPSERPTEPPSEQPTEPPTDSKPPSPSSPPLAIIEDSPTTVDQPIIMPPTTIPGGDSDMSAHSLPQAGVGSTSGGSDGSLSSPCEDSKTWESQYGDCGDYELAYNFWCDDDRGSDGILAMDACPQACGICEKSPTQKPATPKVPTVVTPRTPPVVATSRTPPVVLTPSSPASRHDCGNCLREGRKEAGCDNTYIERCVCNKDRYCCDDDYDGLCVDIAIRDCNCSDDNRL